MARAPAVVYSQTCLRARGAQCAMSSPRRRHHSSVSRPKQKIGDRPGRSWICFAARASGSKRVDTSDDRRQRHHTRASMLSSCPTVPIGDVVARGLAEGARRVTAARWPRRCAAQTGARCAVAGPPRGDQQRVTADTRWGRDPAAVITRARRARVGGRARGRGRDGDAHPATRPATLRRRVRSAIIACEADQSPERACRCSACPPPSRRRAFARRWWPTACCAARSTSRTRTGRARWARRTSPRSASTRAVWLIDELACSVVATGEKLEVSA